MFCVGTSATSPIAAVAPLTSDSDNPATPNIGTALLLRFRFKTCFACDETCFACDMAGTPNYVGCRKAAVEHPSWFVCDRRSRCEVGYWRLNRHSHGGEYTA